MSMVTRTWLKLMNKLPQDTVQTVCLALLDVEEETAKDAIRAIQSVDYRKADEDVMELYNVIMKWESLSPCSNIIKGRKVSVFETTPTLEEYAGVG